MQNKTKIGYNITENMGRAIGIGFVYYKEFSEIYIFINVWRYGIAIGKVTY